MSAALENLILKTQNEILKDFINDEPFDFIKAVIRDRMLQAERIGYQEGRDSAFRAR